MTGKRYGEKVVGSRQSAVGPIEIVSAVKRRLTDVLVSSKLRFEY